MTSTENSQEKLKRTKHDSRPTSAASLPHSSTSSGQPWKIKSDNTNIADRLKLEPDCSLKIINFTSQDAREYICRQFLTEDGNQKGEDRLVYLSVLTVSSSIPASELKADTNVTFYCHLAIHDDSQNNKGDIKLVWTGFDHHQVKDPYNISFTRTLTKEDNNRKLQCKVEWKGELKATEDYIINLQGAVVGAVAVALCAFLVFLWRRKASADFRCSFPPSLTTTSLALSRRPGGRLRHLPLHFGRICKGLHIQ
ncbi:uncharacterized protein LOC125299349 [Alosa alosa]|uniref:uncharacterized protein LOC125299349 n=1 Tax=Alosa alosa TaxID=278164 RepID=UPI00201505FE|nr:uncharacterized protein LOC125299349 [Alosa alosa]